MRAAARRSEVARVTGVPFESEAYVPEREVVMRARQPGGHHGGDRQGRHKGPIDGHGIGTNAIGRDASSYEDDEAPRVLPGELLTNKRGRR